MLADWNYHNPFIDDIGSVIFGAILCLVPILFVVFAARWACEDAEARGMSKVVPVILVVLFFPIGLAFWLLMRPKKKEFDFKLYKYEFEQGRTKLQQKNKEPEV